MHRVSDASSRQRDRKDRPVLLVGCSGWQYRHWRGSFYPPEVPAARWLEFYSTVFQTVEVNNSFYRLPESATFEAWRARVGPSFVFAVKASRYLTHLKRLKDPEEPVGRVFERARSLRRKLGPVLYQLPPRWGCNLDRLREFLEVLPRHPQAVEFRDAGWYRDDVFALLERHGVALCIHDMAGSEAPIVRVGPLVYLRLHGVKRYGGAYPSRTLERWAGWLDEEHAAGRDAYVYFNNDVGGHAPKDARQLREMLRA